MTTNKQFSLSRIFLYILTGGLLLPACALFKTPEPRLPETLEVEIFNITPARPALRIEGKYYNSNFFGFTIDGGELDLKLDTFLLGHVKIDTVIHVESESYFTVPVVVEPDFDRMSKIGLDLTNAVPISFKGTMNGTAGWFSKSINIEYQGKHFLDLKINGR